MEGFLFLEPVSAPRVAAPISGDLDPATQTRSVSKKGKCAGLTRRDCLQLGLGTLVGGGLASVLRARDQAVEPKRQARSCILIWMDGGPTHYETFDPKPRAPVEIRGELKPIATSVPGIQISELFPRLARCADQYCIVKSVTHYQDASILAEVSKNLGEAMVGRNAARMPEGEKLAVRGW